MSQLNIPLEGTSLLAEIFSEEDNIRLKSCEDFTCFEAYGDYKIYSLFSEYVKLSDKQEPLVLPLIQAQQLPESELTDDSNSDLTKESESDITNESESDLTNESESDLTDKSVVTETKQEEFWPQGENNCCNLLKRSIFFFPDMHVPRYFYLLNPYAALQSAVVWTYSRVFGENDIDKLKAQIAISPFSWLKNFKTFWNLTLRFWSEGYPDKAHYLLGKFFNETVILSAIESANFNRNKDTNYDPFFEIFAKEAGLKIYFDAEKDNFTVKKPHKASALTNNSMFRGCFCFCCLKESSNQHEQREHLINECLPIFYNRRIIDDNSEPMFHCRACMTVDEHYNYEQIVYHALYSCPMNFRTKCSYCGIKENLCECTINRQYLNNCLGSLIELGDGSRANLCNLSNSYILTLYLEFEKQERLDVLDSFLGGTKTWPTPGLFYYQTNLVDMDLNIYIQKEIDNNLMLFIRYTNQTVRQENVNQILNYLYDKSSHYKKIPKLYDDLQIVKTTLTLNQYHDLDNRCSICLDEITGDHNHIEIKHPSCWCSPNHRFLNKEEMIGHTIEHICKIRCPIDNCKVLMTTFKDIILHCEDHNELGIVDRLPCTSNVRLNWRECTALIGYPLMTKQHVAIYHLNSKAEYQLFLSSFKNLKLNFEESTYDLNMSSTTKQISFDLPDTLTKKISKKDQNEQKPRVNTTQPTQTQSSTVNNTTSIATGNINYGTTGVIGNSGGDGNDDDSDNNDESHTWTRRMRMEITNMILFPCESSECKEKATLFYSKEELDVHIKYNHACPKKFCLFASMHDDILLDHILKHKSINSDEYSCHFCGELFVDMDQLETHISITHNLICLVCKKTDFTSRASLKKHVDQCTSASLDIVDTKNYNTNQPIFHLLNWLAKKDSIDKNELSKIKAIAIKNQQMTATPELYLKKNKSFFKVPHFDDTLKPISIPNTRLKTIPKFIPGGKKIANYVSMNMLYQELVFIKHEFRITEKTFCSLLLQQTDESAKYQIISIIQGEIYNTNLEDLLATIQTLFYDINLSYIHAQAMCLTREIHETIMEFFGRAKQITELASFYLNTEEEQSSFKITNLRITFLRAAGENFTQLIAKREAEGCMRYTPAQLIATYNIQIENKRYTEDMNMTTIRYISNHRKSRSVNPLLSLESDIEMTENFSRGRDMERYPKSKGVPFHRKKYASKFRMPRSLSHYRAPSKKKKKKNKIKRALYKTKRANKKLLNMTKDPTQTHEYKSKTNFVKYPTKVNLDTREKTRRNPSIESQKKLKTLNFPVDGSILVCFLCGKSNSHHSYDCKTYRDEICTDIQCKQCGLFHDVSICKKHPKAMNIRNIPGRLIVN